MNINRRSFVMGTAAAGAALTAGAALAEPPAQSEAPAQADDYDWRAKPEEVTDFVEEVTCDAVVVGAGFAGVNCFRYLSEQGIKVILVEKSEEDTWAHVGNEFASINSEVLKQRGVPEIDEVEYYQNWQRIHGNQCNPELIMKFVRNSADATASWLDQFSAEELEGMTTAFFPPTENQITELNGIKFYASVCSFYGNPNETMIGRRNMDVAIAAGGEIRWGNWAEYLTQDASGAITGIVCEGPDGYIKYNCPVVACCCGGFGGNAAMMRDLIPDMQAALVEGEKLSSMSANNGRGVQMAMWAGARMETVVGGMNMKGLSVPGKMNVLPQAMWVNEHGVRYCNEFYPVAEQRGAQGIYSTRATKWAVCDDNFTTYRTYTIPQHAGFNATEENIAALRESLDEAYAKFDGTWVEPETTEDAGSQGGPMTTASFIADDTIEGLGAQMGFEGAELEAFVNQVAEWNEICASGADTQFGRDAKVLFPLDTPPFYACEFHPELGETMVTMGGIITDGDQRALDKDYEPIPGLYVSGNDCGRRFGVEYCTPTPGVSLGIAITLGRECGKSIMKTFFA